MEPRLQSQPDEEEAVDDPDFFNEEDPLDLNNPVARRLRQRLGVGGSDDESLRALQASPNPNTLVLNAHAL
ncbi:hypothetical protein Pmani_015814 [Petrolisthes manimaculis]|uniref:Uncharacterized protein n=1 Tax=Petrolisthes manimaculis TaxID=1843537 RepID=A0AAE1PTP1_9EUCA|nr:hypothetical protein Pmani_015814 [Petrolisthes manimaculis]